MKLTSILALFTLIAIVKGSWLTAAVQPVILSLGAVLTSIDSDLADMLDVQTIEWKKYLPFINKQDKQEAQPAEKSKTKKKKKKEQTVGDKFVEIDPEKNKKEEDTKYVNEEPDINEELLKEEIKQLHENAKKGIFGPLD